MGNNLLIPPSIAPALVTEIVQEFDIIITPFVKTGKFELDRRVNTVTIVNQGATIITVNQVLFIYPGTPGVNSGESFTFAGLRNEIMNRNGRLDISFATGAGVAVIIQKIYLK